VLNGIANQLPSLAMDDGGTHHTGMKELLVYGVSGIASLFIFGYCVHIFVGGMVSEQTELLLIIVVVVISAAVTGWLIWDALKRTR